MEINANFEGDLVAWLMPHPTVGIAILGSMGLLLAICAVLDARDGLVPDLFTVPYAIIGIFSSFLYGRILTGFVATASLLFMLLPRSEQLLPKRRNAGLDKARGTEPALGGADIIIFIGLFALYDPIPFLYGTTITIFGHILIYIPCCIRKRSWHIHTPLLPSVLFMAPLRLYFCIRIAELSVALSFLGEI